MSASKQTIVILLLILLQMSMPVTNQGIKPNQNTSQNEEIANNQQTNNKINIKETTASNYDLAVFPTKSEFTLEENIIIVVMLYTKDTMTPIMDSVTVNTPLGTRIIQLTDTINQITLGKEDFINGINTITVTYGELTKRVEILRQDPVSKGPIGTTIKINEILNDQPAPGVPEKINFTINNADELIFPTDTNEYFSVQLSYQSIQLVVATNFYTANNFLEYDEITFTIPDFLVQQNYTFNLLYSGNTFLASNQSTISLKIHDYTPVIYSQLSSTLISRSNAVNETTTLLKVKIQGYLPTTLQVSFYLNTNYQYSVNITEYRQNIPIVVGPNVAIGNYELEATFSYNGGQNVTSTTAIEVVNKIGLVIRTDKQFFTLNDPVLFDFFCFDPQTFAGVGCTIEMKNGSTIILTMVTANGHYDQSYNFTNLDTSKIYTYTFNVTPAQGLNLYQNNIQFNAQFYHNTSIDINIQQNIVDKTQLLSLKADVNGIFTIRDINNLIIATYQYNHAGLYANYFITFNNTHRGLNSFTVDFTAQDSNYSNVTQSLDLYFYDTITIQSVQTNASFYQLNSYIMMRGVATIGDQLDSLNNATVTLLLNGAILTNTTIQTNQFTFIVPTPNSTGIKEYQVAIYGDDNQFILTSTAYAITVSVVNNFGLNFDNLTYQVRDTIHLQIFGLENRQYQLYYDLNGSETNLLEFIYNQSFTFNLTFQTFGHYIIYLEEKNSGEVVYYGINVLQNPAVVLEYGLLETYKNNTVNINILNYVGAFRAKIDNLYQNYDSYYNNQQGNTTITIYNVRSGNHSITLLFDNGYTLNKVRTYYVILYQRIELQSVSYTNKGVQLQEEDAITMHLKFKQYSNVSLNDIAIQIVTNENTILAQANIFNSESDFQMTVIGDNLKLIIVANERQYIHEEEIPLNLTVNHLLTSNIKSSYSYNSAATLKIQFGYKYFPVPINLTMEYILSSDNGEVSNTSYGRVLALHLNNNGNYNLSILVSGPNCVNQSFQTTISLQKFLDISNMGLVTVVGMAIAIPIAITGITLIKKRKNLV